MGFQQQRLKKTESNLHGAVQDMQLRAGERLDRMKAKEVTGQISIRNLDSALFGTAQVAAFLSAFFEARRRQIGNDSGVLITAMAAAIPAVGRMIRTKSRQMGVMARRVMRHRMLMTGAVMVGVSMAGTRTMPQRSKSDRDREHQQECPSKDRVFAVL